MPRNIDELTRIHEEPQIDGMNGPLTIKTGILTSKELDFRYVSRLDQDARVFNNVRSPCLLASAGIQLEELEKIHFDFGIRKAVPVTGSPRTSVIAVGATIDNDPRKYDRQNFAEASSVIVGDTACQEFLAELADAYCIFEVADTTLAG